MALPDAPASLVLLMEDALTGAGERLERLSLEESPSAITMNSLLPPPPVTREREEPI